MKVLLLHGFKQKKDVQIDRCSTIRGISHKAKSSNKIKEIASYLKLIFEQFQYFIIKIEGANGVFSVNFTWGHIENEWCPKRRYHRFTEFYQVLLGFMEFPLVFSSFFLGFTGVNCFLKIHWLKREFHCCHSVLPIY